MVVEQVEAHLRVERVLRIVVLRGDAARRHVAVGEVGAQVLRTAVDRHRVVGRPARLVEFLGIVGGLGREFAAPTVGLVGRAVGVLEIGQRDRGVDRRVARHAHRNASRRSRLGRNHDGAVGGHGSVERGGRCALQQRDRRDVVGVDRGHGVAAVAVAAVVALHLACQTVLAEGGVHHQGHAVHDHQRLVRAADRLVTAEEDLRGAARTRRVGGDLQTGRLALQRVDHVDRLDVGHIVAAHRFGRIGQRLRLTLDAHGGHDHGVELVGGLLHQNLQRRLSRIGHLVGIVSHVGHLKHVAVLKTVQEELAVHVGRRSARGVLHDHRGPEQRAGGVLDHTFEGSVTPPLRIRPQSGSRLHDAHCH